MSSNKGRKTEDATGHLATHGSEHELEVLVAVAMGKHPGDQINQIVMQRILFGRVFHRHGFWLARGEVADVSPAGAVDEGKKGVKLFQLADQIEAGFAG